MSSLRIAIACGGTGGHLFPGIAVAQALHERGHEVMLLVSAKQIDAVALKDYPNFRAEVVPGMGWTGINPQALRFFFKVLQARTVCRGLFKSFKPHAVLGMGGFTSAVPLLVGRRMKAATYLHESNAIPGRVTKILAKQVSRVFLGFDACTSHLIGANTVVTGTPLRKDLVRISRDEAIAQLGLHPRLKTILVMGGSQGARGVNELVLKSLPLWEREKDQWQFIHLTGEMDATIVDINYRRSRLNAYVKAFSANMGQLLSASDLVISRSGASSLTEISAFGLPSILIPFPAAIDDHQTLNARVFSNVGAAYLEPQHKLTPEILDLKVSEIFNQAGRWDVMKAASLNLFKSDASERIAIEIEKGAA
jgi:UDP-N-acetylglucosamine--N-acetylmuramyl-(pentapeptide) pyrophosphoryl-undecaprenol N-acetylglucosamine transferase